jgi:hypothetical protein
MKRKIKAWLKRNFLIQDSTVYNAIIESFGSAGPKEIIKELVEEGMEIKPETALDIVTRYNRKCAELTFRGYNVNTGLVLMRLVIRGLFHDNTWDSKRNSLYAAITQGAELREAAADTAVEIMGEHPDKIALYHVTDLSTGKMDGTLTRGFNAELKGTYIRITGGNELCGLYLHNVEKGGETRIETKYIAVNDPSQVIFIVPPTIAEGTYELRIATQYTTGVKPLKQPRSITLPCMVDIV